VLQEEEEQISGNSFLLLQRQRERERERERQTDRQTDRQTERERMNTAYSLKRKIRTYLESVQRYIQKVYKNNPYIQPYNCFVSNQTNLLLSENSGMQIVLWEYGCLNGSINKPA
jgi:hypothetical protein